MVGEFLFREAEESQHSLEHVLKPPMYGNTLGQQQQTSLSIYRCLTKFSSGRVPEPHFLYVVLAEKNNNPPFFFIAETGKRNLMCCCQKKCLLGQN